MAAPKGGIFGKILDIDLTTGTHKVRTYDEALARKLLDNLIGCRGFSRTAGTG